MGELKQLKHHRTMDRMPHLVDKLPNREGQRDGFPGLDAVDGGTLNELATGIISAIVNGVTGKLKRWEN